MMILEEIKKIDSSKKKLREFACVVGGAFAVLAVLVWWRGKSFYPVFAILAVLLAVFGALAPAVLKPLQRAWMALAIMMGWVMSRVILTVLFYVAVTPIGLLTRLFGKDFLDMKFKDGRASYWGGRVTTQKLKEDFEKQF